MKLHVRIIYYKSKLLKKKMKNKFISIIKVCTFVSTKFPQKK